MSVLSVKPGTNEPESQEERSPHGRYCNARNHALQALTVNLLAIRSGVSGSLPLGLIMVFWG